MKMNDKDWKILKTVAEVQNLTIAAECLYITQPALTYRLKNLEKEFNARLFIRTPRGIILTSQGEGLLYYAKNMILELEKTKSKINNMNDEIQGRLTLGLSPNYAKYKLSKLLKSFLKLYPKVEFSIKTGLSNQIYQFLQHEELSLAIIRGDYAWSEARHLLSEEPVLLTSHCEMAVDDLPNMPGIMYETDVLFQKEILDWWREQFSCPPQFAMYINDAETCRQLVSLGLGWSILPAIDGDNAQYPNLYTRQLVHRNDMPLTRRTWLIYRHSSLELSQVRAFVNYLTIDKLP